MKSFSELRRNAVLDGDWGQPDVGAVEQEERKITMTVKELIEMLSEHPGDAKVEVDIEDAVFDEGDEFEFKGTTLMYPKFDSCSVVTLDIVKQ